MKKLLFKIGVYAITIFVLLECYVRIFHLSSDVPKRVIDEFGVEKRISNQTGTNITGNRRQHATTYKINENGFNSIRSQISSSENFKLALIGDSYIEGFHQDYNNSLGRMIETELDSVEVYEYGCGGYDLADQFHMINAYKDKFAELDLIVVYMKYENDLERSIYTTNQIRLNKMNNVVGKIRNFSKLLSYGGGLGLINKFGKFLKSLKLPVNSASQDSSKSLITDSTKIKNFETLISNYGINKNKVKLLLDSRNTCPNFLAFCDDIGMCYIDFAETLKHAEKETTFIYDTHWNSYGRNLLAKKISDCVANNVH